MTSKYFCNLIVLFCVCVFASTPLFGFSGGNGTAASPYQIANMTDIDIFRDSISINNWSNNKYFILTNDIATLQYPLQYDNSV
ncbi:MAG: hypothetical protein LBO69_01355 [Ignavibacteria bacterium]|jgi:hypothetical protein|nr:hypothetical protein [Ignavibacteria bacterium]